MSAFKPEKDLNDIVKRYLSGKASAEEISFIDEYYNFLGKRDISEQVPNEELQFLEDQNFKAIQNKIAADNKYNLNTVYKYISIAAALVLVCGSIFFLRDQKILSSSSTTKAKVENLDVLPGSDKAILTLANGKKVVLDANTAANISDTNGISISKTEDGKLVYTVLNREIFDKSSVSFNTIETPNGGQYQVVLPDGTKVWLNAASALKYPEVFVGNERSVQLTGEAYFEVAKNKMKPFHVKSKNQDVEVLGTHFNINSYLDDKTIKTTLLEGSIKITNQKSSKILQPGEQAIAGIAENAFIHVSNDVDLDDQVAWKNGLFRFNDSELRDVLIQLERWYDVKIDYSSLPNKRYNGMVPRKSKLSQVLAMLEKTGNIKFQLTEGKRLKVISKT